MGVYTEEQREKLIGELCEHLALGGTFRAWCDKEDHPARSTMLDWIESTAERRNQYTRAYELQADYLAEELLAIADDQTDDWTVSERKGEQVVVVNETAIARARLQVETRKWLMGKRKPKVYGDRLNVDQQGEIKVLVSYGVAAAPALSEGVIEADFVDQTSHNVQGETEKA